MITVDNSKTVPAMLSGNWVSVSKRVPKRKGHYLVRRMDGPAFSWEFHADRFFGVVIDFWFEPDDEYAPLDPEEHALCRLVDAIGAEMKKKLIKKYRKDGYSGWDNEANAYSIASMLAEHVKKGDPVDIANLAAFLWNFQQP